MEIKKNPQVDAEKTRLPFTLLGLFFSAAFIFMAFTYSSGKKDEGKDGDEKDKKDVAFENVVEQDEPPPPEDTPPPPDVPEMPPPPTEDVKEVEKEDDQTKTSFGPPDLAPIAKPAEKTEVPDEIFDVVEEDPGFPNGEEEMQRFIKSNIKYPEISIQMGDQGKVYVRFVVEKDGSISNVSIARSVTPELDREAMRVVRMMPKWNPGKQRGRPVRTNVVIPIVFKLG